MLLILMSIMTNDAKHFLKFSGIFNLWKSCRNSVEFLHTFYPVCPNFKISCNWYICQTKLTLVH